MEPTTYIPDAIPPEFWQVIDRAKPLQPDYMPLFADMDEIDIIRFAWNYEEAALLFKEFFQSTYDFSEDSLYEFCFWVVAQGKTFYRDLWEKCETELATDTSKVLQYKSDPGICAAARESFFQRTGEEIPKKEADGFF